MQKQLDARYRRFGLSGPHWVLCNFGRDVGLPGLRGWTTDPQRRTEHTIIPSERFQKWFAKERKDHPPSNQPPMTT